MAGHQDGPRGVIGGTDPHGSELYGHRHSNDDPNTTALKWDELELDATKGVPVDDGIRQVMELARKLTTQSTHSQIGDEVENPFVFMPGSTMDPTSDHFDAQKYARAVLDLQHQEPDKFVPRNSGLAFKNLDVYGFGNASDFQKSVVNVLLETVGWVKRMIGSEKPQKIVILRDMIGLVESGEMLVVLGPPGSGCSTFLKTIAGETHGFNVEPSSYMNYKGISPTRMHKDFRGEVIYTAEVDVHFPMLSVGDTLTFAARAKVPRFIPGGVSKNVYANHSRDVVMAMFGIIHTLDTRVGDDFIRGVSGGERKRVTIAEAVLSGAPLQCWDNSTRGLDSANAIEFCKTLRTSAQITNTTSIVSIYQSPQSAYNLFDKVTVLYEGRQIYFGCTTKAKEYFIKMGFECPSRQSTPDFLTSMTSSRERIVRSQFEGRVPRTPDEFASAWKDSLEYQKLLNQIDDYNQKYPIDGASLETFQHSRKLQQGRGQRVKSPYTLTYSQQVKLCLWRGWRRLVADPTMTISQLVANFIISLVLASIFFNLKQDSDSFFARGTLIYFAILMNAFGCALEVLTLYAQRPIVEKHSRYAFHHASSEAFASMLMDLPAKVGNAIIFNTTLYFMTNLRREPGPFFFFVLVSFLLTLNMSMIFRSLAALSRTLAQAMVPTALFILMVIIYTGFVIPVKYMYNWNRWLCYLNPVYYGVESLMANEFHEQEYPCSSLVPSGEGYENLGSMQQVCSAVGSVPGSKFVNGDRYINTVFSYYHSHKWRNVGIIIAFTIFFMAIYLVATEWITAKKSHGEVLVFRRKHLAKKNKHLKFGDIEGPSTNRHVVETEKKNDSSSNDVFERQTSIFHWQDVCYDIKIKGQPRRILDNVNGWVKPGTLTALMGVSGAGKTTLLDVLATRVTTGVITGDMLVDGCQRDASFQRKTGYIQQQDLHLSTSTVREALNFSALLRQPAEVSTEDKLDYVEKVIKLLDMEDYANAVVGCPGEGLNVEQRKRLTIGTELAARPQLLLFLDEPTSGLDSQTSWAICDLMEKLKDLGQAILCTIHQPSAMLFQRFDRLLFLAKGGKTVYFGDIGENSRIVTTYFEKNGASPCPPDANPAEWILEVIGATAHSTKTNNLDWHKIWRSSIEFQGVQNELAGLKKNTKILDATNINAGHVHHKEFAASFSTQFRQVTVRVFQQFWRSPSFIHSKLFLCGLSSGFVGFSFFQAQNTQQGLLNQMFSIFILLTIFNQLVEQSLPHFVTQRSLYEARERPSKVYSWQAFMLANIVVDIPWCIAMAILLFFPWYYTVGFYYNASATNTVSEKGGLMFLFILTFLVFTSTFGIMLIAGMESAEDAASLTLLIYTLFLMLCGVLAAPTAMPGFWIFMYRLSPFTYFVSGMLSTAITGAAVACASDEYLNFIPPFNTTCAAYMEPYMLKAGTGYLLHPEATDSCNLCTFDTTEAFLTRFNAPYSEAWRNFGIIWAYIAFNILASLALYWLVRVPKSRSKSQK